MPYLLVPLDVSTTAATFWIGGLNEEVPAQGLSLVCNGVAHPVGSGWSRWDSQSGALRLLHQKLAITGLQERTAHQVMLNQNGVSLADASFTTLPSILPGRNEKPFTVLLGSCFYAGEDAAGLAGRAYRAIKPAERPELKILCGDQVYLDAPWWQYLLRHYSAAELEERFFTHYQRTWAQQGTLSGFREVLRCGGVYFSSDDHEFWNNAPNAAAYVLNTWTDGGRSEWFDLALQFYQMFQPAGSIATFEVGALSFFVADTRIHRKADLREIMKPDDLDKLQQWIEDLAGPGVLVMGQPLFAEQTGWTGRFKDWNLPDYEQYPPLARALLDSSHSILFLTGDVHFGRVARCALASGAEIIEIISSPLALVDSAAGGSWASAPDYFPAFAIPGAAKRAIQTELEFQLTDNHFLTLEFGQAGGRIHMVVKAWPIPQDGSEPQSQSVYEHWLF